jgi:ABC-type lipoprotein export system ATPase subunit
LLIFRDYILKTIDLLNKGGCENALRVTDANKSFGTVQVLCGVDLEIKRGERVALMGPSGSGKSTLLNCICGIEPLDRGTIKVGEHDLSTLSNQELEKLRRHSIGYVFQSFHLLPTLTAFENIEFAAQLVGMENSERIKRVEELMDFIGLTHRKEHFPDALSGGERQRVALARALIHQPSLVLADEPTGSLDTEAGSQVLELLSSLSEKQGVAILLVTHDRASTHICDRVISMKDGVLTAG